MRTKKLIAFLLAVILCVACAASALQGGRIEIRLDTPYAKPIATLVVPCTGGWEQWKTVTTSVSAVTGKHDVYFTFAGNKGAKLFNLDWWQFKTSPTSPV